MFFKELNHTKKITNKNTLQNKTMKSILTILFFTFSFTYYTFSSPALRSDSINSSLQYNSFKCANNADKNLNQDSKIIYVKIQDSSPGKGFMLISYGDGKTEMIELPSVRKDDNVAESTEITRKKIESIILNGYKIIGFSVSVNIYGYYREILFSKE